MPARFATAVIVLFWLGTSAWLFHNDIWPRLRPGDPPPYVLNVHDEELNSRPPVSWTVYRDDPNKPFGRLYTSVAYFKEDDTFLLKSRFTQIEPANLFGFQARILQLKQEEQVTRDGDLRKVTVEMEATIGVLGLALDDAKGKLRLDGVVRDGRLHARMQVNDEDVPVDSVPVTRRSGMLLTMHPVNQLAGLRAGQRWQVSLANPLRDLFSALVRKRFGFSLGGDSGSTTLAAEVLAEPKELVWAGGRDSCWVIEYRGGDDTAQTWVRQSDGLVVRQEARRGEEVLILQRQ
jgi:hypothetical protein